MRGWRRHSMAWCYRREYIARTLAGQGRAALVGLRGTVSPEETMRCVKLLVAAVLLCSCPVAAQDGDREAVDLLLRGEREVISTEAQQNRFETTHLILYIDRGVLAGDGPRQFAKQLERGFVAVSDALSRKFDSERFRVKKPTYYLTDRAGISHVNGAHVFLRAARVVDSPAIAVHETVHLLLGTDPAAPRNFPITPPEIEATTGVWLAEGFASHVATQLAPRLGLLPYRLFLRGDDSTVHSEAMEWLDDPRGKAVVPYVGSRGWPPGLLADRVDVAPPFYVLSQSFVKFVTARAGLRAMAQLYDDHFNGHASIEDDVRRITKLELAQWRADWLRALEK